MDDIELNELQDPSTWADEGEIRPPVKRSRAVVSVAFARDDFQQVSDYATQLGMRTSEFIRKAALDATSRGRSRAVIQSVSGSVKTGFTPKATNKRKVKVETKNDDAHASA